MEKKTQIQDLKKTLLNSLQTISEPSCLTDDSSRDRYVVFVFFYEIYNGMVFDLLKYPKRKPKAIRKSDESLTVSYDKREKSFYLKDLTYIPVNNAAEALGLLAYAKSNLAIDNNGINEKSSRSHAAFGFKLLSLTSLTMSQLCFNDLAGSERRISTSTKLDKKIEAESVFFDNSLKNINMVLKLKADNHECTYRFGPLVQMMSYFFEHPGSIKYMVCLSPYNPFSSLSTVLDSAMCANKIVTPQELVNSTASRVSPVFIILFIYYILFFIQKYSYNPSKVYILVAL